MKDITTFFFNGEEYYTTQSINILELINYFNYHSSLIVVEHNNFICEKLKWNETQIKKDDSIEIITIVGGG